MPCATPPRTWPSTTAGLIITPQSSTTTYRSTVTAPVSGSIRTTAPCAGSENGPGGRPRRRVRERAGRIEARVRVEPRLDVPGQAVDLEVGEPRDVLERDVVAGRATPRDAPAAQLEVLRRGLQHVRADPLDALGEPDRGQLGRAAANHGGAAPERAPAVRGRVRVALDHLDAPGVEPELVGGDLRERRAVLLAVAGGADRPGHARARGHPHPGRLVARGHHHLALGEDLAAVARPLGEAGEADAEQPAL